MQFSTRSEYGLRALVNLAKDKTKQPISLATIAEQEKLPLGYLERLFSGLKKARIIKSVKGVNGGYLLSRPATQINMKEILEVLEGDINVYRCVAKGKNVCPVGNCQTKRVWMKIQAEINKTLGKTHLNDLI